MIRWFARNDVAANFLLVAILFLGIHAALTKIPLEVRPTFNLNEVDIRMTYRGATPADVERTIVLPIEQAMEGLPGVEEIRSEANSGRAEIEIQPKRDADIDKMLEEVQRRVDAISTFPNETDRPRIRIPNTESFWEVCTVMIYGDLSESDLLKAAHKVRDDLLNLPGVSQVEISGNRDREVSVEANPELLRGYGLSMEDLTNAVRRSSIDLPGGSIRTAAGRLLLRTKSQAYTREDFEEILIRSEEGSELRLKDVARVDDGFGDDNAIMRYNRQRSMRIELLRSGNESAINISNATQKYIEESVNRFPEGVKLAMWDDESISMRSRLSILGSSLAIGALLVFLLLGIFLRPSLAFFVTLGIPVSFAGGLLLMPHDLAIFPWGPITLNQMSVFGFIIVVGIVVDDAIVTGENIYSRMRQSSDSLEAAIQGTKEVATPVTFGVLTTIVAFVPLLFYDGWYGNFARQIPPVVAGVLIFSLVESKLILPSHLKHIRVNRKKIGPFGRFQKWFADALEAFVNKIYSPVLKFSARHRYATLALFIAMGLAAIGYKAGGHVGWEFIPRIDRYQIYSYVYMPADTKFEQTDVIIDKMTTAAEQLADEFRDPKTGESWIRGIMSGTGTSHRGRASESYGMVSIEIVPPDERSVRGPDNAELEARYRELVGPLPEAERFGVYGQHRSRGNEDEGIEVELRGPMSDQKREVAKKIEELLENYEDIPRANPNMGGKRNELEIRLKPRARELDLNERQLADQIRTSFVGNELQRIQRDREEIRVFLRFPKQLRENMHTLTSMEVVTGNGSKVPFSHVANITTVEAPVEINRKNGAQVHYITASAKDKGVDMIGIAEDAAPKIDGIIKEANADDLSWRYTGFVEEHYKTNKQTTWNWIIILVSLYALLAIPFKGLLQPIFVLLAVPFGLVGAMIGHVIVGIPLSQFSVFGMLALSGVVVNDSLVMVDFINRKVRDGIPLREAVLSAGGARFRPIILTSLTTFVGLLPLIMDKSIEAQSLIPMAVSLAYGILFATGVTLFLIPCAYLVNEDLKRFVVGLWSWYSNPFKEKEEALPVAETE